MTKVGHDRTGKNAQTAKHRHDSILPDNRKQVRRPRAEKTERLSIYVGRAGLFDEMNSWPEGFHPVSGREFPAMGRFHRSALGRIADGPFGLIGSALPVALIMRATR